MREPCALGIDLGTSAAKAALYGISGRLLGAASTPITTLRSPGGHAEQNPEQVWQAVASAITTVVRAAPVSPEDILAVGCCGQYSSIVPVNAEGRAAANMVLWMDNRGGDHTLAIHERHPEAFETFLAHHGIPPLDSGNDSLAHILHLTLDRPDLARRTRVFLEPVDYVNLRLTGRAAATQCTMFMSLLCDNRTLSATGYDPELVSMAGVDERMLPELLPIDATVGTVLPDVADWLGLSRATAVIAGGNDTQAACLATRAGEHGRGGLCVGTTSVVVDQVDFKHTDIDNQVLSMPGLLPGSYAVMAENGIGGRALDHLLGSLLLARDALGDHHVEQPWGSVDALVGDVPAGSDGLLFLPWLNGSLAPDGNPAMRGGFLNLKLDTTRAHLVRAAMEGVAYNLRRLLPAVEAFAGRRYESLVMSGGAARSDAWTRILADVLERPIRRVAEPTHANCRAMAALALERLGRSGADGALATPDTSGVVEPDPAAGRVYAPLFEQFQSSFERTRPVFEALNG
ncbi:MAG TPA: FGGY-family carbohydrate kinase [Gammaproteobacteria bacterium]|nr:FGGY-family carbohydrate kinase [Gammaproteobacteria bacterium]